MSCAGLLWVCATNDLGTWVIVSFILFEANSVQVGRVENTIGNCLFSVETVPKQDQRQQYEINKRYRNHIRSLLSSETLEDNLSIGIYPQVLDGLRVDRAGRGISPSLHGSDILEGRESITAEGLHCCKKEFGRVGEEREESV